MGVIVISAVDNTTDTFTSVAHGLNTGDGAAAVFVGTGGVIPTGLAPVTDCWVIRTGADTFKLASSSANALANVPINITTNGTLPLSLLIGLPYRVPMTAAAGVQIKSANDNSAWQSLVAIWNLLTGQAQALWNAITLAVPLNANAGIVVPTGQTIQLPAGSALKRGLRTIQIHPHKLVSIGTGVQAPVYQQGVTSHVETDFVTAGTPIAAAAPVDGLYVGDRIVNARFYVHDVNGQTGLIAKVLGGDRAGGGAFNATTATSAGNGTTQTLTLTGVNHTIGTTSTGPVSVAVNTLINATGTYSVYAIELDVDTP